MNVIVISIISGLLGAAGMSIVMSFIHSPKFANADMIRAIGSIYTRSLDNSFTPGLVIHFIIGALISFVYVGLITIMSPTSPIITTGIGGMIGLFHGVAVGFILVVAVAEYHPLKQFQEAGVEVAIAHLVGHVIYGVIVGAVIGYTGIRF